VFVMVGVALSVIDLIVCERIDFILGNDLIHVTSGLGWGLGG
jgi:hypothetical protein